MFFQYYSNIGMLILLFSNKSPTWNFRIFSCDRSRKVLNVRVMKLSMSLAHYYLNRLCL